MILMNSSHFVQDQLLAMPLGLANAQLKISASETLHVEKNEICFL